METKKIEKFKKTNLRNISSNMYSFLKNNNKKRIIINRNFNFDDYKESIGYELVDFCSDYTTLANSSNQELQRIAFKKRFLKEYVDEILDNEYMLEYFTIYKIQQFINKVGRSLLENNYDNFFTISNKEKYIEYKNIEIDATSVIGFVTADKVISYLYKEFSLKKLNPSEYEESLLLKNLESVKQNPTYIDEINKLLFKAAVNVNERSQKVIGHPVKDDDTIFRYLCEGFVADKIPKKVLRRERKEDTSELIIE